jgi:beta-phosphoglucomutase-like phosphatase (HAD superfamily)
VVIEDSPRGVEAALAAGTTVIHVTPASGHPGASAIIRDLSELSVDRSGALVIDRG